MPRPARPEIDETVDERFKRLIRDIASCAIVNAGSFSASIPGDRREPRLNDGEFVIDLYDEHVLVAQVIVRDKRYKRSPGSSGLFPNPVL